MSNSTSLSHLFYYAAPRGCGARHVGLALPDVNLFAHGSRGGGRLFQARTRSLRSFEQRQKLRQRHFQGFEMFYRISPGYRVSAPVCITFLCLFLFICTDTTLFLHSYDNSSVLTVPRSVCSRETECVENSSRFQRERTPFTSSVLIQIALSS